MALSRCYLNKGGSTLKKLELVRKKVRKPWGERRKQIAEAVLQSLGWQKPKVVEFVCIPIEQLRKETKKFLPEDFCLSTSALITALRKDPTLRPLMHFTVKENVEYVTLCSPEMTKAFDIVLNNIRRAESPLRLVA
jgi:hypothetical protein